MTRLPRIGDIAERLQARHYLDNNGCWNWIGQRNNDGYGMTSVGGHLRLAHRVSFEHFVGPVVDGLVLDHLCRNRACINPKHLEPVTQRENSLRSDVSLAAINSAKTHCPQGHPYDEANTYVYAPRNRKTVGRRCKTCKAEYDRARHIAKKELAR